MTTRNIAKVTPYTRSTGVKRCKVELDGGQIVPLHSLTRPELQRAASLVFPSIPGNVWLKLTSEVLQSLIRENDLEAAEAAVKHTGTSKPKPKTGITQSHQALHETGECFCDDPTGKGKAPAVTKSADPADQLADAIRKLTEGKGVDHDTLVKVVQEEVAKVASEVRITRVEVRLPDKTVEAPKLCHKDFPKVLAKVAAGVNVFLVGPAGTGKSVMAEQLATVLSTGFGATSFGPTTPTSKLFGYKDGNGTFQETPLYTCYTQGGIFLGDELDNGHPGLLAEQNQFLSANYCAFANGMAERNEAFRYIATGNTYGRGGDRLFIGRNQLDAATLDRFVFHQLEIDEKLEEAAALRWSTPDSNIACREWIATVRSIRKQVASLKLQVVVSPRASIDGCKLVTTGAFTKTEVIEDVLFKGIDSELRSKLTVV